MPCRSPQTVSVAQPTPYLSMSQQHPSLNGGMSQQPSQQPPQLTPQQIQQNSQQQQQQQNKQKTAPSYNEKAMAVIRNSLRPFEQADQPLRPVSSLSTGSSNNSNYSDCIHTLMNMGFDEVSRIFNDYLSNWEWADFSADYLKTRWLLNKKKTFLLFAMSLAPNYGH